MKIFKQTSPLLGVLSIAIGSIISVISGSGLATAEGSGQFNLDQYLNENTTLYADVLNAGETINISLCRNASITIYNTNGTPANNGDDTVANSGSLTANITCSDAMSGPLTGAYEYTPASAGTYRIVFDATTSPVERYDFSVTANSSTDPDPTQANGRVWSYKWNMTARSAGGGCTLFCESVATNANMFIKVPAPNVGEDFVWKLDLNKFAGAAYSIVANGIGLDAPYSGISAATADSTVTEEFPIYLGYPESAGASSTATPILSNLSFKDDADQDSTFTPAVTPGLQDEGNFKFTSNVDNSNYSIVIDTNDNGDFGTGDVTLLGRAVSGVNTVNWDGKYPDGSPVPAGTYDVKVQLRIGEYHFIATDVETSGGNNGSWQNGLTIYKSLDESTDVPILVYWDDVTEFGADPLSTANLPDGVMAGSTADDDSDGRADGYHTWGNFTSTGFGNNRNIDTYVYGDTTTNTSLTTTISTTVTDTDGDLVNDEQEGADGTDFSDPLDYKDTDGDLVPDYVETTDGTNPANITSFKDTDTGGTPDYVEVTLFVNAGLPATNPANINDDPRDTDGDLVPDYLELKNGTDPSDISDYKDTDGDLVPDYVEIYIESTNPNDAEDYKDTDLDLVPNYVEAVIDTTNSSSGVNYKDTDGDLVPDYQELKDGTDSSDNEDYVDTDTGGTPDYVEVTRFVNSGLTATNINNAADDPRDTDGDLVPDYVELKDGTDPSDDEDFKDTDTGGTPDYVETTLFVDEGITGTNPGDDEDDQRDTDGDLVTDYQELKDGTDPDDVTGYEDTDGDLVPDYVETNIDGTNPNDDSDYKDTDGDLVPDYVEINIESTDPFDNHNYKDTDGDLVPDYVEITDGTNPANITSFKDTDTGGTPDYVETTLFVNYSLAATNINDDEDDQRDTDGDLVPDYQELKDGTDSSDNEDYVDTDTGGTPDYVEVTRFVNSGLTATNINNAADDPRDTDGDLVPDYLELKDGTNPANITSFKDTDTGGTPDYVEVTLFVNAGLPATNPANINDDPRDTDGDLVPDYLELKNGTDPSDISDYKDTDGDLVPDYVEIYIESTNPNDAEDYKDTDLDLVPNYVEAVIDTTNSSSGVNYKDTDGDLVPDYQELKDGTDSSDNEDYVDTDTGGTPDYVEVTRFVNSGLTATNINNAADDPRDTDGDLVPDYVELKDGTDPSDDEDFKDTDTGGTPDYVETTLFVDEGITGTNPGDDEDDQRDTDGDLVTDYQELKDGTDPDDVTGYEDTDGDLVPDYVETNIDGTNPNDDSDYKDTDGDLVPDYVEINIESTDPFDNHNYKDTDGDLVPDYVEITDGTNPANITSFKDTDTGGTPDYVETTLFVNYSLAATNINDDEDDQRDTDGDLVPDYQELKDGTDSSDNEDYVDTDGDLVPDYVEAIDVTDETDGLVYKDSDDDLVPDYIENIDGTDPNDKTDYKDTDEGGLADYIEITYYPNAGSTATNPNGDSDDDKDLDGDGVPDQVEIQDGTTVGGGSSFVDTDGDDVPNYIDPDDENDNVPDAIEALAPNGGDANDDGIQDNEQSTVTSFVNPVTLKYVTLETTGCLANSDVGATAENSNTTQDPTYDYPSGLMNLSVLCANPGDTVTITQYYYGVSPGNLVLRKYNRVTHTYTTVTGAVFTSVTIGGQQATKVVYQVTDGGPLDEDGVANGIIVDPAGLASLNPADPATPGAPNTGFEQESVIVPALSMAVGLAILTRRAVRRRVTNA